MLFDRKKIYDGRVIQVSVDTVDLPNGVRLPLEIVRHPGGAAAVAIDAENRVCLLRQYRHAAGGYIYELPAGKLEPDEAARDHRPAGARRRSRDLGEPMGIARRVFQLAGRVHRSDPPVPRDRSCARRAAAPEADEVFEVEWWPLEEAVAEGAATASSPTRKQSSEFCEPRHEKKLRETVHSAAIRGARNGRYVKQRNLRVVHTSRRVR